MAQRNRDDGLSVEQRVEKLLAEYRERRAALIAEETDLTAKIELLEGVFDYRPPRRVRNRKPVNPDSPRSKALRESWKRRKEAAATAATERKEQG